MVAPSPAAESIAVAKVDRDASFPSLLFVLTVATGLVDAVSYLALGHVFVANMTGNVVFLGFAIAGSTEFSIAASALAIAAFLTGALAGGRLAMSMGLHRSRFLAVGILVELALVGAALLIAFTVTPFNADIASYGLIVLLALAMGLQNATARSLAIPDLTTTVLTLTLTGLAADSTLAGGTNPRWTRRLSSAGAMFAGAAVGGFLVLHFGTSAALALTFALLAVNAVLAYRVWSRSPQ